ncbi:MULTISPECIES: nitrite reductase small subunit NirD [Aliivibrio]|uniref:Nitrite reductase (NADH) small subunit n=1 Tax=Aliivibrio finisterrensis TaxID=511998 RepID=A0A4Q5KRA3_9GAMM|nr:MULTISPECIES: nitrite reductase small subunit NirD [Aliivibrio]KAB2824074.1 nitrite reductase small subunit NirD [Aliivibrio finisterrensis]MDD9173250.1 nitrite reductase small subunit NirD [Aliivibrio sp. S3TY1]MDD9180528.1 nitrite reductase small subunit NirD [Aliivibrio sp. A6]MDD9190326.1 nitrite reductase small subunit NirD [Aliivibrio sp. S2TY2]RYU47137.1 nitrite reductase small subunit NirD [Aliivibrio finisterrensis]
MTSKFVKICQLEDIIPGTGVCALVNGEQVAVFRPSKGEDVLAISNTDPYFQSNVLSRGLIVEHQGELWVASPLKKQRFNLTTGVCMEDEQFNVKAYKTRVTKGAVEISA